jgi:hypothetical protein
MAVLAALIAGWAGCTQESSVHRVRDLSVGPDLATTGVPDAAVSDGAVGELGLPDLRAPDLASMVGPTPDLSVTVPDLRVGPYCDDLGCVIPLVPMSGDLFFTEIMIDPPGTDVGEYAELYVAAPEAIDLAGCTVSSSGGAETFVIPSTLVARPGTYITLAHTDDAAALGFQPTLSYGGGIHLANTNADDLTLICAGRTIASIAFGGTNAFKVPPQGVALELAPDHLALASSGDATLWCQATAPLTQSAGAAHGTPGAPNTCKLPCSAAEPDGACGAPQVCDGTRCVNPCGVAGGSFCRAPTVCSGASCVLPCGLDGGSYCASDGGSFCYQGACSDPATIACALGGTMCAPNQTCSSGVCYDNCSVAPSTGYCPNGLLCTGDGTCLVPCDATHPDGGCSAAGVHCYRGACTGACAVGAKGWCAAAGDDCNAGTGACTAAARPVAGDVFISEILIDAPTVGGVSEKGEYVELFNASSKVVNLNGCSLVSESQSDAIAVDVVLAPFHYAVARDDTAGFTYDYTAALTFHNISFSNSSADWVALRCDGADVDGVGWKANPSYPNIGSTVTEGDAYERSSASLYAGTATASATWCRNTTGPLHTITRNATGGTGTFNGTPVAPNACP